MSDIAGSATGDVATVFESVRGYTQSIVPTGYGDAPGTWGSGRSPIRINPYFTELRVNSPVNGQCGLPGVYHVLTDTYYHEARHAYQFSLTNLDNDEDQDYLVNQIDVAPFNIFIDTTDSRAVCDEYQSDPTKQVLQMPFMGPKNFDAYGDQKTSQPGVGFAVEMDAHTFANQHKSQ